MSERAIYRAALGDFVSESPNPFSPDGAYGPDWTALLVRSGDDPNWSFCGRSKSGLFTYIYMIDRPNIREVLADFLRYENSVGRKPILSFPEDNQTGRDMERFVEEALATTPTAHVVRPTDSRWLVHSTTEAAGEEILADGVLKSLAQLRKEGRPIGSRLGFDSLQEPPEYIDFIHFADYSTVGPERVNAENQAGMFLSDPENASYHPGYRFYFDSHRIIQDGLDVRTVGIILARGKLRLEPYLVAALSVSEVDPFGKVKTWTPRLFTEAANDRFEACIARKR